VEKLKNSNRSLSQKITNAQQLVDKGHFVQQYLKIVVTNEPMAK